MKKETFQEDLYYLPYHWMMKGYLRVSVEFRNKFVLKYLNNNRTEKLLDLGEGDVAVGTVKAIETGLLDSPFSSSRYAAGKVIGFRDSHGAVRYSDFGNLPFTKHIMGYHREKLAERGEKLGREVDYEMAVNDIHAIDEGLFIRNK